MKNKMPLLKLALNLLELSFAYRQSLPITEVAYPRVMEVYDDAVRMLLDYAPSDEFRTAARQVAYHGFMQIHVEEMLNLLNTQDQELCIERGAA
jgi:hypothetical protein